MHAFRFITPFAKLTLAPFNLFQTANRKLLQDAELELKKSKRKDYYKILSVSKTASDEEIKKAYKKHALLHHPGKDFRDTHSYPYSLNYKKHTL